jgi:hypothetical protein
VTRNPDDVMLQILVAQVLAGTPGAGDKAVQRLDTIKADTIKADYKLTTAHQDILIATRTVPSGSPPLVSLAQLQQTLQKSDQAKQKARAQRHGNRA